MLSFSLELTENFVVGTFAPKWLHRGSYDFSPPVAQQFQVGPYSRFPIPFNWTSCFVVSAVSGYLGFFILAWIYSEVNGPAVSWEGVFVVLLDIFSRDSYGFTACTQLLGKPLQTAVMLSAPVSPNLCLAI